MSNDTPILKELSKFQSEFDAKVLHLFAVGNLIDGKKAWSDWSDNFYEFLYRKLPDKAELYHGHVLGRELTRSSTNKTLLELFNDEIGNWVTTFFEDLSNDITSRRVIVMENDFDIKRKVFVVHGRNEELRIQFFHFLRSLDIHTIEWSEARKLTRKPTPSISDILDSAFSNAQAIIVLMTPDDVAFLDEKYIKETDPEYEKKPTHQPRQNVIFESGMAWGRHPDRTLLVRIGNLRTMSDTSGIHFVDLDNTTKTRQELALRLRDAGCIVNTDGTDWQSAGDLRL